MLQGDAASPIRPPCTDSSRLTETRGVRNHPDPVNGASGPAPSNAPQPSTAAASSCAATGARRLEAFRAHEDTRRQRLPTVRAGVRRSSRLTAGRWARRRCWRVRVRVRRPRVRRPAASVRTLEPSRPRPSASLREYVWLACFHCPPARRRLPHPFATSASPRRRTTALRPRASRRGWLAAATGAAAPATSRTARRARTTRSPTSASWGARPSTRRSRRS